MTGPSPLVSVDWLADHLDDPDLIIADVRWYLAEPGRGRQAYLDGHMPGAVFVDVDTDLTARDGPGRHPLPSPEVFTSRMASLGIDAGTRVVAYDDVGGWVASRLWWMLDALGNDRVAVLDGGIEAWVAAGGSLTTADPPTRPTSTRPERPTTRCTGLLAARRRSRDRPGLSRQRGPPRRAKRPPLPRRDGAHRPSRGTHPDRHQCPDRRQPGSRRPLPAGLGLAASVRRPRRVGGRVARGHHVVRQRHLGLSQRPRDAGRRAAGPGPVRGFVLGLEPGRVASGRWPRSGTDRSPDGYAAGEVAGDATRERRTMASAARAASASALAASASDSVAATACTTGSRSTRSSGLTGLSKK